MSKFSVFREVSNLQRSSKDIINKTISSKLCLLIELISFSVIVELMGGILVVESSNGYFFLYARYPKYAPKEANAAIVMIFKALSEFPISEIAFNQSRPGYPGRVYRKVFNGISQLQSFQIQDS